MKVLLGRGRGWADVLGFQEKFLDLVVDHANAGPIAISSVTGRSRRRRNWRSTRSLHQRLLGVPMILVTECGDAFVIVVAGVAP
jgi:hypothetical protein